MQKTTWIGCLLLVAGFACGNVSAQGWLAGASAGTAKQYDYEVGGPITLTNDTATGYRVFGGYLFNKVMGVVVSYVDLGEPDYAGPAFGGFTDHLSAKGLDVSYLVGFAPGSQERFTIFGTAGFFRWNQDVHYVDDTGTYDYRDRGTSFSYGAGGEVSFGEGATDHG